MSWFLAPALEQLRDELNARWPGRDKSSDGAIGDAAHRASASDHNPNSVGAVCAYDIDTDLDGTDDSNDPEMDRLVEWFRTHPHPNVKYVIYRGRIFRAYDKPGVPAFEWSAYTKDPHISHPHISVGQGSDGQSRPGTYDDRSSWLPPLGSTDDMPLSQEDLDKIDGLIRKRIKEDGALGAADPRANGNATVVAKLDQVLAALANAPLAASGVHGDVQATIHFP